MDMLRARCCNVSILPVGPLLLRAISRGGSVPAFPTFAGKPLILTAASRLSSLIMLLLLRDDSAALNTALTVNGRRPRLIGRRRGHNTVARHLLRIVVLKIWVRRLLQVSHRAMSYLPI